VKPMTDRVDNWSAYLSDVSEVNELPELISLHARTGRPLGDELFMAMLEKVTGRDLLPKWPGRPAADREK
jgi:putative transposase